MKNLVLTLLSIIPISTYTFSQTDSAKYFFTLGQSEMAAARTLPAYQYFQRAIVFSPNDANYLRQAGITAVQLRKNESAKQDFEQLYQLDKNDTTAIIQLAQINFALRKWNDAIVYADLMRQKQLGHRYN